MRDFRKLAHLVEQLGEERFQTLISSDNTGKVKKFCDELVKLSLPTEMTVGGRTYEILGFLRKGGEHMLGYTMVEHAKEMAAHLGVDDGEHILKYQDEIPVALRGQVAFLFTDWPYLDDYGRFFCIYYLRDGHRWVTHWIWLSDSWRDGFRVLRRKSAP